MQRLLGMMVGGGQTSQHGERKNSNNSSGVDGQSAASADNTNGKLSKKKAKKEMKKTLDAAFNPDNFDAFEDNTPQNV